MVNAQYWLGLRSLAAAIGIEEEVVRFRIDDERNTLVIEVNDPKLREIPDGVCAPIVGQVRLTQPGDNYPDCWEFTVDKVPATGLMPIKTALPKESDERGRAGGA